MRAILAGQPRGVGLSVMRRSPPLIRDGTLAWPGAAGGHVVQVGTEAWSCWLEAPGTTSFRFEHQLGSFTARRERQAVADYWYAYRKYRGRLFKVYLGRSKDLTPRRLEEVASSLAARADLARGGGQITSAGDTAATGSGHVPQPIRRGPRIWQVATEPTSFVGRQDEIAQALELLPSTRLLTLTGEGGIGKTRLAVRVAAATAQHYPEGVRLIDLASLKMPADVPR